MIVLIVIVVIGVVAVPFVVLLAETEIFATAMITLAETLVVVLLLIGLFATKEHYRHLANRRWEQNSAKVEQLRVAREHEASVARQFVQLTREIAETAQRIRHWHFTSGEDRSMAYAVRAQITLSVLGNAAYSGLPIEVESTLTYFDSLSRFDKGILSQLSQRLWHIMPDTFTDEASPRLEEWKNDVDSRLICAICKDSEGKPDWQVESAGSLVRHLQKRRVRELAWTLWNRARDEGYYGEDILDRPGMRAAYELSWFGIESQRQTEYVDRFPMKD